MEPIKSAYEQAYEYAKQEGRPVVNDGDYICNICGEPWEVWGVNKGGDMEPEEKDLFKQGKGCPACRQNLRESGKCFFETGLCGRAILMHYNSAGECPYLGECDNCDR